MIAVEFIDMLYNLEIAMIRMFSGFAKFGVDDTRIYNVNSSLHAFDCATMFFHVDWKEYQLIVPLDMGLSAVYDRKKHASNDAIQTLCEYNFVEAK